MKLCTTWPSKCDCRLFIAVATPHDTTSLMKEWLVKMRRDYWTPHSYSTICSDHFEERCFDRTGQTTRLYKDAVPTVFNFPHPNTQNFKTSHQATPRRQTALEDITHSNINVPITPAKKSATIHDHTYSINESPRSVKRKLDRMFDHTTTLKKRLKSSQSKSRHLRKKVDTLENIETTVWWTTPQHHPDTHYHSLTWSLWFPSYY
uniref:THAP-type domain-containing protein n=1 Tax=Eptatretus burgeri TaxID=7764 RepID=A0A8C4R6Q0_EPTBU